MAEITRYPLFHHLRAESSSHVLRFRRGRLVHEGPGLAFWFRPLVTSLVEIPRDDQELSFLFHGRSADFQEVTVQGVVTYRVSDPRQLAERIDFSIDLAQGRYLKQPFEKLGLAITQLAQQFTWEYLSSNALRDLLHHGVAEIRTRISAGLQADDGVGQSGLAIVSVRVSALSPTPELEKALQTPTREALQQEADEATFRRRAAAVDKERAIQENELANQIELARREAQLIDQQGQNRQRSATEEAAAARIAAEAAAARRRIEADAEADATRALRAAEVGAERERMAIYRGLAPGLVAALGVRELAGKLERIEHLNLTPDLLAPLLARLAEAGAQRLEGPADGDG